MVGRRAAIMGLRGVIQYLMESHLLVAGVERINPALRVVLEALAAAVLEVEVRQRALVGQGHLVKEAMVVLEEEQAIILAVAVVVQVL